MNPPVAALFKSRPVDDDMANQALPGHGTPLKDPESAAQVPLETGETQRKGNSVLVGGSAVAGMATGAVIGKVVAGFGGQV